MPNKNNRVKSTSLIFAYFVLILLLLASYVLIGNSHYLNNSYKYVTALSLITLIIQLYQTKKAGISNMSVISVFVILLHIFHCGNFYVKAFGKEEFFIFGEWFSSDLECKTQMGLCVVCMIQAIHIGVLTYLHSLRNKNIEYKFVRKYSDKQKEKALWFVGWILLAITTPFRLMWDYNAILESAMYGEYSGVTAANGLADDLQVLFIPSLICIMCGKKSNKRFNQVVMVIYIIGAVFVMTASGARRQYITGIFAILIYYYNTFMKQSKKKKNLFAYGIYFVLAMVMFNLLYLIRAYRKVSLGIVAIVINNFGELFSLNFIWETIAEFGITGNALVYAIDYLPEVFPYQYGKTFLFSTIYILPVGWLVKLQASVGAMLFKYTGNAVGGSVLTDLFANWGWFSCFAAIVMGYLIAALSNLNGNGKEIKSVVGYATGSIILSYARGGTLETLRPIVTFIFIVYFLSKVYFEFLERKEEKNVKI